MKISKRWVEQFTDIELDNDELVKRIGAQLGAVEGIEDWAKYFDDQIVVAEITEAKDHPDADKLGLYTIVIDEAGGTRQLVAGDKTLSKGDHVAYIPPGVNVPHSVREGEPFEIGEREIRGELSQGMLCSAKEALFSDDHAGVVKLDQDAPVGMSLKQAYMLDDLIIDVENKMFTHRPDLFGILGVAREIAGIQDLQFKSPDWYMHEAEDVFDQPVVSELPLNVENQIPELCPRFSAVVLDEVEIKPSPLLVQSMMNRVGLRPINNLVDATNSVMYLTAQPSHAFDYDKVAKLSAGDEPSIVVRMAKRGEKLAILDGREIEMGDQVMVVASDKRALSVAGCIGGTDSEVDASTKRVILEVANWNLYSIRRTSYAHGIFTDAVTRYSKGQSPDQCRMAANQVIAQLVQTTPAKVASKLIDDYQSPLTHSDIKLTSEFVNTRLGSDMSLGEIASILGNTEITSHTAGGELTVKVPFWRMDLQVAEDLVEEVGRLVGFDNLPITLPTRKSSPNRREKMLELKTQIRHSMSAAGAKEILSYNFVPEKLMKKAGYQDQLIGEAYRIRNSISPELEMMRVSLLASQLEKVNPNVRLGQKNFVLYELNKAHNKKELDNSDLPIERDLMAAVVASETGEGAAFYRAKRYLEMTLKNLGLTAEYVTDRGASNPWESAILSSLEPKRAAAVMVGGDCIGYIGEPKSAVSQSFKLPSKCAMFEIDIGLIEPQQRIYLPISKFPASHQDITLEVPDKLSYAEVFELVDNGLKTDDVMIALEPQSIYRAELTDKRRISFRVSFRSPERTLKTNEINEQVAKVVAALEAKGVQQI